MVKRLLTKGETAVLKGFKSKAGKSFSAALVLKEGKVEFDFTKKLLIERRVVPTCTLRKQKEEHHETCLRLNPTTWGFL